MQVILKGMGVSSGVIRGSVKIILEKHDWPTFQSGDILVTRITDPSMVPLMAKAGGIICDIGSMMSHPAIVARELGIPCIVAAHSATQILKTDQIVQMDGSSGVVLLVDE